MALPTPVEPSLYMSMRAFEVPNQSMIVPELVSRTHMPVLAARVSMPARPVRASLENLPRRSLPPLLASPMTLQTANMLSTVALRISQRDRSALCSDWR